MFGRFRKTNDPALETDGGAVAVRGGAGMGAAHPASHNGKAAAAIRERIFIGASLPSARGRVQPKAALHKAQTASRSVASVSGATWVGSSFRRARCWMRRSSR